MTHPQARSKPRRRERHSPQDRIRLTDKGRALLAALDNDRALAGLTTFRNALKRDSLDGAAPCAPNRGKSAPAALPAHDAGTAAAPPAHPAGKSGAADRANKPETKP